MKPLRWPTVVEGMVLIAAFLIVLCVHAAIPGITMPTLGQAIWTTSFSQAFAHDGLLSIHASDIGIPRPAAISFGLAGALPCAWYIALGLVPLDAYTAMVATWLAVAFVGSVALCRRLGVNWLLSGGLALLWLCMPMAWFHDGFSMLGLGIALLPAYLWTTVRFLVASDLRGLLLIVVAATISAFMDGYTFVMFAFAAGLVCAGALLSTRDPQEKRRVITRAIPAHVLAFGLAFAMYSAYVYGGDYERAPLDMFRAWGLDVAFAWVPTSGQIWLWDALRLSTPRDPNTLYGDASVWLSTFAAPLLVAAGYAAWRARRNVMTASLVIVALLGLYLSLGPSLKIDTHKPASVTNPLMPADAAMAPTGTRFLFKHVPGFRMMRAPYRWAAVGYLACWMLVALLCAQRRPGSKSEYVLVAAVILLMFPHLGRRITEGRILHAMAESVETDWVGALRSARVGPVIAFAPYGNDFLAAYATSRLNVSSFNIGGDKNLEQAMKQWPFAMVDLGDPAKPSAAASIAVFLAEGTGDQVVIPYVDLIVASQSWPCPNSYTPDGSVGADPNACVSDTKRRYAATVETLRQSPILQVTDYPLFAVISLGPTYAGPAGRERAKLSLLADVKYPINVLGDLEAARAVLRGGWYPEEATVRWSHEKAHLTLPVPASCHATVCRLTVEVVAFAASDARPVRVTLSRSDNSAIRTSIEISDNAPHILVVALPQDRDTFAVTMDVPDAISPAALGVSEDGRVLGVDLRRVDVTPLTSTEAESSPRTK